MAVIKFNDAKKDIPEGTTVVFTDGSARPADGGSHVNSGWAIVKMVAGGGEPVHFSDYSNTLTCSYTVELEAIVQAAERFTDQHMVIVTDNENASRFINEVAAPRATDDRPDSLEKQAAQRWVAATQHRDIPVMWVRGHAPNSDGHEMNALADALANVARSHGEKTQIPEVFVAASHSPTTGISGWSWSIRRSKKKIVTQSGFRRGLKSNQNGYLVAVVDALLTLDGPLTVALQDETTVDWLRAGRHHDLAMDLDAPDDNRKRLAQALVALTAGRDITFSAGRSLPPAGKHLLKSAAKEAKRLRALGEQGASPAKKVPA